MRVIPRMIADMCSEIIDHAAKGNQVGVHRMNARLVEFVGLASHDTTIRERAARTADHLRDLARELRT